MADRIIGAIQEEVELQDNETINLKHVLEFDAVQNYFEYLQNKFPSEDYNRVAKNLVNALVARNYIYHTHKEATAKPEQVLDELLPRISNMLQEMMVPADPLMDCSKELSTAFCRKWMETEWYSTSYMRKVADSLIQRINHIKSIYDRYSGETIENNQVNLEDWR